MEFQTENELYQYFKEGLKRAEEHLEGEYGSIRAGRANPKILDRVMVNYYGSMTPLNQMANITVPDPRCLLINIWDMSAFKDVLKAINEANLGLTPSDDGKSIRLVFPVPTEDRRRELVKQAKVLLEDTKVGMRNERRDAMDAVKKMKNNNVLTEDMQKRAEQEIQKILDEATKRADELFNEKEKEIMSV